jgi:hypothetical protein
VSEAIDAAFETAAREAARRKTCLVMVETAKSATSPSAVVCAYPPATVTQVTIVTWMRANYPELGDTFLFFPPAQIARALADFDKD